MSRQSVFKHEVDALYIVKAMFFNNKSINTQLIPMPIWVAQLSLVGHKEKKKTNTWKWMEALWQKEGTGGGERGIR